jgi:hypothetical protein
MKTEKGTLSPQERVRQKNALNAIRTLLDRDKLSDPIKIRTIHCLSLIGMRSLTDAWYGKIFTSAPPRAICGELTPEYALLPDAGVEHMLKLNSNVKIIFLMRDPVDRAWSSLRMGQRYGSLADVQEGLRRPALVAMCDYMTTIERFRRFVSPSNLLLLYYDDVAERPQELLVRLCRFMGVSFARGKFSNMNKVIYEGQKQALDADVYELLKRSLAPIYERLLTLDNPLVDGWYRRHYGAAPVRQSRPADVMEIDATSENTEPPLRSFPTRQFS